MGGKLFFNTKKLSEIKFADWKNYLLNKLFLDFIKYFNIQGTFLKVLFWIV